MWWKKIQTGRDAGFESMGVYGEKREEPHDAFYYLPPEVNGCKFLLWPFAWTAVPTPHSTAFTILDSVAA